MKLKSLNLGWRRDCSRALSNLWDMGMKIKSRYSALFLSLDETLCAWKHLLTYLRTPLSKVFLEKLTGFQLVKKFPAFYGTPKFITLFTNAGHLSLSWASSIQPMPPHPTAWKSILILSPIYTWDFQVVSCPQVSPPKLCISLFSPRYLLLAPPISFFLIGSTSATNSTRWRHGGTSGLYRI